MTDYILAWIITGALLLVTFLWVPTLEACGPRCQKFFLTRRTTREKAAQKLTESIEEVVIAPLLPRRV